LSTLVSDFPDQMQVMPDLGLKAIIGVDQTMIGLPPAGAKIPSQPVPSGITMGPDGTVYVSELTGVPFAPGSARIYTIEEGSAEVLGTGFTTIIDLAFGDDQDRFVLEYATGGMLSLMGFAPPSGALKRVVGETAVDVGGDNLSTPSGMTICDGILYVSDSGGVAGTGRILKAAI